MKKKIHISDEDKNKTIASEREKELKSLKLALGEIQISKPTVEMHPDACLIIEFEDHGQDFLYWQLDADGKVVASMPYQSEIWNGTIVNLKELKLGEQPLIITKYGKFSSINYKVLSVQA